MVSVLWYVLAGVVLYTVGMAALKDRGWLPDAIKLSGPITTIHTGKGRELLDRLSAPRRFWRAWGNLGIGMALVVMVGMTLLVASSAYAILTQPDAAPSYDPQHMLVIPGVNEFLPLSAAHYIVFGLVVGLVVHEGGHGLLCRVEDIEIESLGLALFTIIPIGAFVEPDEESQGAADRGARTRMFAAGVTNNFAITLLALLLLFGPVMASIGPAAGAGVGDVLPGSSADQAGLAHGDVIVGVNGTAVENATALDRRLDAVGGSRVAVELRRGDVVPVERQLVLMGGSTAIIGNLSMSGDMLPRVEAVNGTAVSTEREFRAALEGRTVVRLETTAGTTTFPVGAFVTRVADGGALAEAGAPTDGSLVVSQIGDRRVVDAESLSAALDAYGVGERVTVAGYVDGERETWDVEIGANADGEPILGVFVTDGYSSVVLEDFGIDVYPADRFATIVGGGPSGLLGGLADGTLFVAFVLLLVVPFLSLIDPSASYNFFGFVGEVQNFYVVDGPLGFLGGGVFVLASALFWTAWINFNLGIFNCIPAFPLDGGHIMRSAVEAVVARLPVSAKRSVATALVTAITLVMIGGVLAMLFGPALLG